MAQPHASLFELALAEQEARNAAALAAIRSRSDDILEAQKLVAALAARGLKIRALVDTRPVGINALCYITLWLSATRAELEAMKQWCTQVDIAIARDALLDQGDVVVYTLMLRGQSLRLNAAIHDKTREPLRFRPCQAPEAA